jgi:hypothetical protein
VYLYAGDLERYRRACRQLVERAEGPAVQNAQVTDWAAKTCALAPDSVPDFSRVERLATRAVTGTKAHPYYRLFMLAKGLTEYRAGQYEQAVVWLEQFKPGANGVHWDASAFAGLAMAHHRLGHSDQASASLRSARAIVANKPVDAMSGPWLDWLHSEILLREAEKTLAK